MKLHPETYCRIPGRRGRRQSLVRLSSQSECWPIVEVKQAMLLFVWPSDSENLHVSRIEILEKPEVLESQLFEVHFRVLFESLSGSLEVHFHVNEKKMWITGVLAP